MAALPPPDLLVIPQVGTAIPGDHLTPQEADDVKKAWTDYGIRTVAIRTTWDIAIAHIIDGQPAITARLTIPRDMTAAA